MRWGDAEKNALLETERRLRGMACPECGSLGSLRTVIRCELASGECRYTVRCQQCGIVFTLRTTHPELLTRDFHARLTGLVCPACGKQGAEAFLRCEVPSRSCFYLVACVSCGHEYTEPRIELVGG